ncbi:cell surface protein SprA [bacterium]|nr:cell surface protein SprA [bacterium]
MSVCRKVRITPLHPILFIALLLALAPMARAGVGLSVSLTDNQTASRYLQHPARGISAFGVQPLGKPGETLTRQIRFDSSYTTVTHVVGHGVSHVYQPMIQPLADYVQDRLAWDVRDELVKKRKQTYKAQRKTGSGEGVAIDLPYRIKSRTFRRLFGGDNVGVRVQGNITINGSLRQQKFSELQTANQRNTNTAFRIDMIQRFTITGKVGEKVEVKVDQDSERLFDFENSLKLTYTGDEDEIVQKVEAGNVQLNLSGAKLATYSGKNTGLFGLKTEMKVGPLKVTGIASIERAQKNRQSPNQTTQQAVFNEKQFIANQYFWLTAVDIIPDSAGNPISIPNFRQNYRRFQNRQHLADGQGRQVGDIELFVSTTSLANPEQGQFPGRAAAIQFFDHLYSFPADTFPQDANHVAGVWRKLDKTNDYHIDRTLGFIRLNRALQGGEMLACAFTLQNSAGETAYTFGSMTIQDTTQYGQRRFLLLRYSDPSPSDSTWNLMFRHVYSLQATNLDPNNFKLTIRRTAASGQREETGPPGDNRSYLEFFKFDLEGQGGVPGADGLVDNYPAIVDWTRGELHFLDLRPFDPEGFYDPPTTLGGWQFDSLEAQVDSGGFAAPYLYDNKVSQHNQFGINWQLATEFKGSSSTFYLGHLVLEGSEEVTLNGQPLQRGVDYTIDYLSGQLRILNEAAKAPGANLDITYESGRVFQLDKTTLLGTRAEYSLWDESYIGGMWLYLNQKTLDRRVRIGNEPIRNTMWDVNTHLKFKPNFLSRLVDALPLVTTNAGSEIVIDAEVARVIPNPNSLESPNTGDRNGLAYVDDFEGSRRATPLGMQRRMWSLSSPPTDPAIDRRRGRLRWWNPNTRDQVPVREVFPDREVNSQVANTLQSLILEFTPDPAAVDKSESWGGVMRYLGEGYADQSRAQYLEFWIKLPSPSLQTGRLVVDLGVISEDAIPNGAMDSEDRPLPGQTRPTPTVELGNGLLSPEEDSGLDGIFSADPGDSAWWNGTGTDNYGTALTKTPSWDDWAHASGSSDFAQVNGTENNRNDEGGGYPDTEDLNNNDNLDVVKAYYSYDIELNDGSPYIAGGNYANNWRLFRIPINEENSPVRRSVGNADLTSVRWTRVYLTGFSEPVTIEMVQMDIVSNEWLAQFSGTDSTEYIQPTVVNTHENPGYVPPPGVEGEIDPITNLRQREQSLVLKINALDNDDATNIPSQFFIAKNLYQDLNMLEYRQLRMFVHGGGIPAEMTHPFPEERYQLFLRMGQNYSSIHDNYYEIITNVEEDWNPANNIDVTLNELALMHPKRGEAGLPASARFAMARNPDDPTGGDSLAIKGSPTMSRIGFIAVGVRLREKQFRGMDDEIWVDELRVSNIYKDPGTAAELSSSVQLADFISLSGGYTTRDADFHNVNTRVNAQQASSESWRGNVAVQLQKAYVERWGFRLPLNVAFSETNTTPRVIPGTDSRITPSEAPDSIKAHQETFSYRVQYSKGGNSPNPLVRWGLENLSGSWDYARDDRNDYNTEEAWNVQTGAQASYTIPTNKGRGVKPVWWLKQVPMLKKLGSPTFHYKPTKLLFSAQAARRQSYTADRPSFTVSANDPDSVIISQRVTRTTLFNTTRTFNTGFAPFRPLSLDFARTYKGLLDSTKTWMDVLQYDFGRTTELTQNVGTNYNPEFYRWFKPTFNYTAGYTWNNGNLSQSGRQGVSNQRNFGVDLQLDFRSILGQGGAPSRRPREKPPGPGEPIPQEEGAEATPETTPADTVRVKEPRPSLFSNLGKAFVPFKAALLLFDPVALSYDNGAGHSRTGTIGHAGLPYQLGLSMDPGIAVDTSVISTPAERRNEDFTARSGIRITKDIRSGFNYMHRTSQNISQLATGSVEQSVLWVGKDSDLQVFPFADITMDWSGLERIGFLSRVARSVSLTSSVSQKQRENWSGRSSNVTAREYTRQWGPLLGINFSWKGDIDSQIRYNTSKNFSEGVQQGNRSRSTDSQITGQVSYSIRTGLRLPLPFMSDLRLQNQTTFSLQADYRKQKQESADRPTSPYGLRAATSSWSLQPRITYSFSSSVQGQAYVQLQQNKDEIRESKNRLFEFGVNVNISIRG